MAEQPSDPGLIYLLFASPQVEPKVSRLPPGFQHQGGLKGATRGGSAVKGGAVAASGNDSDQELLV